MTNSSRLDGPEIRAVLEANRAKLAMMQAQQQQAQDRPQAPSAAPTGLPKPPSQTSHTTSNHGSSMRSNPMFGEQVDGSGGAPTPLGSQNDYAPKLAGIIRTPPISGIASDAKLPPVGDLFMPQPQLPLGLDLSSAIPQAPRTPGLPSSSTMSNQDTIPHFSTWDSTRPYLSGRFLFDGAADRAAGRAAAAPAQPLESYPPQVQESMLVDDLLCAFGGFEGTWIRPKLVDGRSGPHLEYTIVARGQLEPALLEMATRMLPLCECAAVISRYSETRRRYEWGVICQALGGAMRGVLQDWELMLAQLEHQLRSGKLTLQALWYYVQPPMAALKLVASIAAEASARRLRGAGLLSLLHNKAAALMGDASSHRLALRLLRAAAEPYFAMLERWLCEGIVDDPYSEFLIREDFAVTKEDLSSDGGSAFWSDRFTLRPALEPLTGAPELRNSPAAGAVGGGGVAYDVPVFLERAQKAILDTGRYINLIKSCGKPVERTLLPGVHLEYDESSRFLLHIEQAHKSAAAAALSLMRHEVGVSRGLAALKRYFLAAQGDVFLGLMDGGETELNELCGKVPLQQLQGALDIAVRCSSAAADPAAARLKAAYDHRSVLNLLIAITQTSGPTGLGDSPTKRPKLRPVVPTAMTAAEKSTVGRQRKARESFMLAYDVPWPLSVVVPDSATAQYQMIFRHLFELKWVERELNRICSLYQLTRPLGIMQRRAAGAGSVRRSSGVIGESAAEAAAALAAAAPPPAATVALTHAYRTCQLMTHFFRQYLLYATFEVLEPLWAALESHIDNAASVDEIVEFHRVFLRRVMKGLLLSRKVVVLRSLLSLKQLALEFVSLSCRHVDMDLGLSELAEGNGGGGGEKGGNTRAQRLEREKKLQSALNAALSTPEFAKEIKELHSKFEARCSDFMSALAEAHRQARSERTDTREELEGLLNLMGRLDFNGYFANAGLGGAALAEQHN